MIALKAELIASFGVGVVVRHILDAGVVVRQLLDAGGGGKK